MLKDVLRWSEKSDKLFMDHTQDITPFANVEAVLKIMVQKADIMVVSSASGKGLDRNWSSSGLKKYAALLGSQETGNKKAQLQLASTGKYIPQNILIIGDGPGDLEAARYIDALFFPIIPGSEEESWLLLIEEALSRFFENRYRGEYEDMLVGKYLDYLCKIVEK
jgi:phosphoglycolate phosphatase-like HAD superfamily hydrolase